MRQLKQGLTKHKKHVPALSERCVHAPFARLFLTMDLPVHRAQMLASQSPITLSSWETTKCQMLLLSLIIYLFMPVSSTKIQDLWEQGPDLPSLLLDPYVGWMNKWYSMYEEREGSKDSFNTTTVSILNFQVKWMRKTSQIHNRIHVHVIFSIPKKTDP